MDVILRVKETGSAEIIVTAVSSSNPRVRPERLLGRTIGAVLRILQRKGYRLKFVTDKFFVCTKQPAVRCRRVVSPCQPSVTLFEQGLQV